ncbi:polymer-forming cytoskeletal protein [Methylacidimicrobium tartarophylax]|nr:polymer-forming cytoskeletal protein [Methylacidimicrobium tartarophylax]
MSKAERRHMGIDGAEKMSLMPGCELRGEIFTQRDGWVGCRFFGTMVVKGRLVLSPSAEVQGVLVAGSIDVEQGARVEGICFVGPHGIEEWKRYLETRSAG